MWKLSLQGNILVLGNKTADDNITKHLSQLAVLQNLLIILAEWLRTEQNKTTPRSGLKISSEAPYKKTKGSLHCHSLFCTYPVDNESDLLIKAEFSSLYKVYKKLLN
ncbi:hypothetical protein Y1Q_0014395 [Alligator mississippiensis]|uniref:Uncharacterized protein n=1 Tax=Alligator mississippiensis TaxID=8496 RepID=A0A151PCF1_ALLMI|nr:hypothetical protein Y1Q_0014395 [Alligator mississippiensis]